jgi:hypothetical protein
MTTSHTTRPDAVSSLGYQFSPGPQGVLLGLSLRQVLLLGSGLLASAGLLLARAPLPLVLLLLTAVAVLACLRIHGRTITDWLPLLVRNVAERLSGASDSHQPLHQGLPQIQLPQRHATRAGRQPGAATDRRQPRTDTAPAWGGITVHPLNDASSDVPRQPSTSTDDIGAEERQQRASSDREPAAVLLDRTHSSIILVLEVAGLDRYGLLEAPEQDRLLHAWGQVLGAITSHRDIYRASLIDRISPASSDPHEQWISNHTSPASSRELVRDYDDLLHAVTSQARTRTGLLSLSLKRPAGNRPLDERDLSRRYEQIIKSLLGAKITARTLTSHELTDQLAAHLNATPAQARPAFEMRWPQHAWQPQSLQRRWDHVRTDDTWHRSYTVRSWPTQPVGPNWLTPLLLSAPAGCARTLAVHLQAVAPEQASRAARTARTRALLDQQDRERLSLSGSAATDSAAVTAETLDTELVAGFTCHRLAAVITLSAANPELLDQAVNQLRDSARHARLDLAPTHGDHAAALFATSPVARLHLT